MKANRPSDTRCGEPVQRAARTLEETIALMEHRVEVIKRLRGLHRMLPESVSLFMDELPGDLAKIVAASPVEPAMEAQIQTERPACVDGFTPCRSCGDTRRRRHRTDGPHKDCPTCTARRSREWRRARARARRKGGQ